MMYFHTGVKEYVLFEDLHTSTVGELTAACVAIFFFALLHEGLKVVMEYLLRRSLTFTKIDPSKTQYHGVHMLSGSHFIHAFIHMVQAFISYCLMLVSMTYNAWFCIALVLGSATGYFLFGWRRSVVADSNEHRH